MKKYLYIFLIIIILFPSNLTIPISADVGPKPSVNIEIKGIEEESYYVTLLSKESASGPWNNNEEYRSAIGDKTILLPKLF